MIDEIGGPFDARRSRGRRPAGGPERVGQAPSGAL